MHSVWFGALIAAILMTATSNPIRGQESESAAWTDLIPMIPTERPVAGTWRRDGSVLRVDAAAGARIAIPFRPTAEYDFRVSFTRETGRHSIALIFTLGGGQAAFDVDAWGENLAGMQLVDDADLRNNSTRTEGIQLRNGQRYTARVEVRKDVVRGFLDDKLLCELKTDGANLRIVDPWRLPAANSLGLGAWDSATAFHAVEIRNLTGMTTPVTTPTATRPGMRPPATSSRNPAADDIARLSDEFDDPGTLENWLRIDQVEQTGADQIERIDIGRSTPGRLTVVPYTSSWYGDWRGVLLHKRVTGDFMATTQVRSTGRDGRGAPNSQYSLAGIMIRAPRNVTPQTWRPGGENYLFLSTGAADRPGRFQFEVKTTIASRSTLRITDANGPEESIRAVRIGSAFVLLRKNRAGSWIVHERYSRPDLPRELQVGITVYTDWPHVERLSPEVHNRTVIRDGRPDLMAAFDYFRFARPRIPDSLSGRNFGDSIQISDAEIVQLFGSD